MGKNLTDYFVTLFLVMTIAFVILSGVEGWCQLNNHIYVNRGETTYLKWQTSGDYSSYDSLYFAVKPCTSLSCGRLSDVSKSVDISYSGPYTTMTCTLYAANTSGLNAAIYYYSIYAYGSDTVLVTNGKLNLQLNGQTVADGVASTTPVHLLAVDSSDQNPGIPVFYDSDNSQHWWSLTTLKDSLQIDSVSLAGNYMTLDTPQDVTGQKNFSGLVHFPDSNSTHISFYNPNDSIYGGFSMTTRNFWINADGVPDVVLRIGHNLGASSGNPLIPGLGEMAIEMESHFISGVQTGYEWHLSFADTSDELHRPITLFMDKHDASVNLGLASSDLQLRVDNNDMYLQIVNGANGYFQNAFNWVYPNNTTGLGWHNADTSAVIYAPYFDGSNRYSLGSATTFSTATGRLDLDQMFLRFDNIYGLQSFDGDANTVTILNYNTNEVNLTATNGDPINLVAQEVFIEDTLGGLYNIKRPFFPPDTSGLEANDRYVDLNTGNVRQKLPENLINNGGFSSWTWDTTSSIHPEYWQAQYIGDTANTYLVNSSDRLRIVSDGSSRLTYYYNDATATSGVTYGYSFYVASYDADSLAFYVGGKPVNVNYISLKAGQYISGEVTPTSTTNLFSFDNLLDTCDVTIDNVRVWRKTGGNFQATSDGDAWSVFYTDANGQKVDLGLGAAGTVLKSNGASTPPSFQSDATGAGGSAYADSVVINGRHVPGDSLYTIEQVDAIVISYVDSNYVLTSETSNWDKNSSNDLTTATSFSGDVSGAYNSIAVTDDSHNHVISNVDALQDSLDDKANRSELGTGAYATIANYSLTSHTHTEFFDTVKVAGWGLKDTVTTGDVIAVQMDNNYTITKVAAYTDAGTVTFNIEERGETTPNTAGTDVMTSDLVADTDNQSTTTFSNATVLRDTWLMLNITSITGDPTSFGVTVRGIKTN